MFHCNTRYSHDWNELKFEFAVGHTDQVPLIKNNWLCWSSAQKYEKNFRKTLIYEEMMSL